MSPRGAAGAAIPLITCALLGALAGWVWLWIVGALVCVAIMVLIDLGVLYVEDRREHRHDPPRLLPAPPHVVSGPTIADGQWLRVIEWGDGHRTVQHLGPQGWTSGEPQAMRATLGLRAP